MNINLNQRIRFAQFYAGGNSPDADLLSTGVRPLTAFEVEATEIREELTKRAISQQFSLVRIKDEVEKILDRYCQKVDRGRQRQIDIWEKSWASINLEGSNLQELKEIQKKLQEQINTVKQLIKAEK